MKANIEINAKQNNESLDKVESIGEYIINEDGYQIIYEENECTNRIMISKNKDIAIVEKESNLSINKYYSKLIFECGRKNECNIEVDGYNIHVNIETIEICTNITEIGLQTLLKYNIEGIYTEVEIKAHKV